MTSTRARIVSGIACAALALASAGCSARGGGDDAADKASDLGKARALAQALDVGGAGANGQQGGWRPLDLTDPADNVVAFTKVRGSLDPNEEVVFYWTGLIYPQVPYASMPPGPPKFETPLFKFEGFNIARFIPIPTGGVTMVSREASFYEDPTTGAILDCWNNPLNNKRVSVVHVWNDPVNFTMTTPTMYTELGDDIVVWNSDQVLAYTSPMPVASYPDYSASNVYQTAEMFNFFTYKTLLDLPWIKSVPVQISWTRAGQFLPWMQMAQTPGQLVYHTRGRKLRRGYADLPANVRAYVEARQPQYQHAPEPPDGSSPRNMTSWRYFKALKDANQYNDTCP